jgi:hypothetical protein
MQSWIRGTFASADRPSASSTAAISLSAEFFAPAMGTVPWRLTPPVNRSRSIGTSIVGPRAPDVGSDGVRVELRALSLAVLAQSSVGGEDVDAGPLLAARHVEEPAVHSSRLPATVLALDP